jgi:hypothetical protein
MNNFFEVKSLLQISVLSKETLTVIGSYMAGSKGYSSLVPQALSYTVRKKI